MNGPGHYREAERWLKHAHGTYMDDSSDSGPREDYTTEADYFAAITESNEAHERSIREAAAFAALGQAHATLAQAAATARAAGPGGMPLTDWRAWHETAGVRRPDEQDGGEA